MKKFSKKYEISKVAIPVNELTVIDPSTVAKDGTFYYLSNYSTKRLASIYSMGSGSFSTKLFDLDPEIWKSLFKKKSSLKDVIDYVAKNNAIIIDEMVVTISEGSSHIEDVVNSINKFIEDESLTTSYSLIDKELLVVVSVNKDGYGVLIKYYFQDNWAVVHDCYYNEAGRELLVAPYYALDKKVESDISELLDKDLLMASSISTMPYQVESYRKQMSEVLMSVDEFCYYMKRFLKIKLGVEPFNTYDYAADHEELPALVVEKLSSLIEKFYSQSTAPMLTHSSYLKRAINLTNISYGEFSSFLEILFLTDNLHINNLIDIQMKVLKRDTHFNQLNS